MNRSKPVRPRSAGSVAEDRSRWKPQAHNEKVGSELPGAGLLEASDPRGVHEVGSGIPSCQSPTNAEEGKNRASHWRPLEESGGAVHLDGAPA